MSNSTQQAAAVWGSFLHFTPPYPCFFTRIVLQALILSNVDIPISKEHYFPGA